MKKSTLITLCALLLVVLAVTTGYVVNTNQNNAQNTAKDQQTEMQTSKKADAKKLSYAGVEGKTALELLQANANDVKMSGEGEMAFVTSINGVAADSSNEFWEFLVNGEQAQVGAGSYTTKATDTITWQLTKFNK